MANSEQPTLTSLSTKIAELSGTLTKVYEEQKIPPVSFAAGSPSIYEYLTPEMFMVRQNLLDALTDMSYLAQGPGDSIFNYVHTAIPDASALSTLNAFNFWSMVPLDGTASYEVISAHVSLPRDVVYRLLPLAKSAGLKALVSAILDDAGAPVMVLNEDLRWYKVGKCELVQDTDKTSFALFHAGGQFGSFRNTWELLENDGEGERNGWRQRKFVEFMEYLKDLFRPKGVVLNYSGWPPEGKVTVVDLDAECIQILRNLVPVLKPSAKVLLIEYIGGAGDEKSDQSADSPRSLKQYGIATDVWLMAISNGKERPSHAWKSIFAAAD
ncbi:sterigmatocystin 8-o-methyltransferase [Seiridium cupressi]